jgi:hypothetical protein
MGVVMLLKKLPRYLIRNCSQLYAFNSHGLPLAPGSDLNRHLPDGIRVSCH